MLNDVWGYVGHATGSLWNGINPATCGAYVVDPAAIVAATLSVTGTSSIAFFSRSRERRVTDARQAAYYMLRTYTSLSLPAIGMIVGRHHATVLHGVRKVPKFRRKYSPILNAVAAALNLPPPKLPPKGKSFQ